MASPAWRPRLRAALIHLICSGLVAALAAALVFWLWYPWPFSVLAGGIGLFVLITGVDVVMGPCLTLVVFDARKPRRELLRDVSVVVLLQLAALGYGLFVMFSARPVVLALETDRFRVVSAIEVASDELAQAPASLSQLSLTGPVVVQTEAPDGQERIEAAIAALGGVDLGMRPKYWRVWDKDARQAALSRAQPLDGLQKRHADRAAELAAAVARTGKPDVGLRYLPLLSRHGDWVVLLDAATGDVAGFAPFNAW